jgi:hypothetical protein
MRHKRIFERRSFRLKALRASLRNVTGTATQWDFPFALQIHPELLRSFTPPHILDDEGYYLVGEIVRVIDAALHGRLPARLVSLGKYLALKVAFVAQHRRRETPETMTLRILIGPCDSHHRAVYVGRIEPPF